MKYAVHLPVFNAFGDARLLADLARAAEDAGWDGFFLWDHLLFCELDKAPHADPWIALTAAAMNTSRIKLGTLVTPLARRRPQKVARETVSLHNLSGGRLILGVGLGDPVEWEYRFFHEETDPKIRAEKLDEGLAILTGLWSGETFGFEGKHYHLEPMTFLPRPVTPIPVWVGGYVPRKKPFQRAARYDGVVPGRADGPMMPDDVREVRAYIAERRTSDTPFDVVVGGAANGDPKNAAAVVAPFIDAGATWWLEDISPIALGVGWEDFWRPWDVNALRGRIEAGPPRG